MRGEGVTKGRNLEFATLCTPPTLATLGTSPHPNSSPHPLITLPSPPPSPLQVPFPTSTTYWNVRVLGVQVFIYPVRRTGNGWPQNVTSLAVDRASANMFLGNPLVWGGQGVGPRGQNVTSLAVVRASANMFLGNPLVGGQGSGGRAKGDTRRAR